MADGSDSKKALVIHAIMNSVMEDVLKFKTACCFRLTDQNVEIRVENRGQVPVAVPSYFDLEGKEGIKRIDTLFPSGWQTIAPNDTIAFYCNVDETIWNNYERLVFYDREGNRYVCRI